MELTWADKIEAKGHERGLLEGKKEGLALGKQEGRVLGKQEGRDLGKQEGKQDLLLRLMERRFGPLPAGIRRRIRSLDSAEALDRLADRILLATSWKDLGLDGDPDPAASRRGNNAKP